MSEKITGILTPHMVPLDDRGRIDESELRRYVDWLIDKGVHGLYPNGSTGEFVRFSADERREIIRIVCDQAAGRVPVLAGAAEANVRETIRACETYHGFGARAVAIVAPFYYKLGPESVYAYFREIALNSPIDVTLYNIPMFASPIDVPTIRRLAEFPRVVAIKDSSGDLAGMMRMIQAVRPVRPDFSFLTGWDVVIVPMLLVGCDGGTNATSGIVPEVTRKLYELAKSGQVEAAMRVQYRLLELFDTMICSADFPEGFRAGAEARGFRMGQGRQPMSEAQRVDRAALDRTLRCILSEYGYVDAPSEGCPPRTGNLPQDRVNQIAATVIQALRERGALVKESLGLLETQGLAPTLGALDRIDKSGDVRLVQCELNDLGGVATKIVGPTAAVLAALEAGRQTAEAMGGHPVATVVHHPDDGAWAGIQSPKTFNPLIEQDVVFFPHFERVAATGREGDSMNQQESFALGIIETQGFTAVFEAIDTACKAANVEVVGKEKLGGGFIAVIVKGELSAVTAAIEAGREKVEGLGKLIAAHVLARPSISVLSLLPRGS